MGSIVMKEAPDVDFYIEWSSVVEAPTFAGTRAEILVHLQRSSDSWLRDDAPHHPERRLERADKTGTSSLWVETAGMRDKYAEEGAWDDDHEIYEQKGTVKRANLFVLARRLLEDGDADLSDLIEPFEDADSSQTGSVPGCDGDRKCTNPRCPRHGIDWDALAAAGSVGAGEDGTVTP